MFDEYIGRKLGPLVDRLAEIEAELEDLRRRADNQARIGIITEVDPAGLCKVSHGDLTTPWIKWFNPSAGQVVETLIPSAGEQCVLINYGGGDGGAHTVALRGLASDAFPPASTVPQLHRRTYPDGAESSYDHDAHVLAWKTGETSLNASRDVLDFGIGQTRIVLTPESAIFSVGEVAMALDAGGIHFTGPVIDHQGRLISEA
ncbi:phage baseplate assembly protein V [Pseudomonas chlororaphis]|uniref:phage baseplate assembly protein V n=1 Tax=Pseudomonas chlororaphis TaxID=587753 RepID=UPI002407EE36|nr:phage baseplate assembly protein V [Pseudomonas chlororaphis]